MGSCWSYWWCCEREVQSPADEGLQIKHLIPPSGHEFQVKMDLLYQAESEMAYAMLGSVQKQRGITASESVLLATKGSEILIAFGDSPSVPDLAQSWIQTLKDMLTDHQQGVGLFPKDKSLGTLLETTAQAQLLQTKQEHERLKTLKRQWEQLSTDQARRDWAKENMNAWRENHQVYSFLQGVAQGRIHSKLWTWGTPEEKEKENLDWQLMVLHMDLASVSKTPTLLRVFRTQTARMRIFDPFQRAVLLSDAMEQKKPMVVDPAEEEEKKQNNNSCVIFTQEAHYMKTGDVLLLASRRIWDRYDEQPSTRQTLETDLYALDQAILTTVHQMIVTADVPGTIVLYRIQPAESRVSRRSHGSKTRVLRPGSV